MQRLLSEAAKLGNSVRWSTALALRLRQGEALGLRWTDVDTSSDVLRVRKNRLRPKCLHGCCGDCGRKPGYGKKRVRENEDTANTKSRAGRRVIGVPDELVRLLELHRREQTRERAIAGEDWRESGFVFTTPVGEPRCRARTTTPGSGCRPMRRADAKVRDGRLHDARQTVATVLFILGVLERVVMQIMGW
ncbi:hypothetical protein [Streptomyces sp. NPDC058382]|uniref:hypothetical protein n=1 Tax=unclassified Streptomyces TaxID=2593676 RepID=UPI00362C0585